MYIKGTRIEDLSNQQFNYLTVTDQWRRNNSKNKLDFRFVL